MTSQVWCRVGTRSEIEARKLRRVQVGDFWVGLFVFEGKIYALEDECPHRGAFLSDGKIGEDGYVVCPLHAWEYHVISGQGKEDWEGCVASFPVEERDGAVYVNASGKEPTRRGSR